MATAPTTVYAPAGAVPESSWRPHVRWLVRGAAVAFVVPYLLADVVKVQRDVYYGVLLASAVALFSAWASDVGFDVRTAARRSWRWAVGLGVVTAAVLAAVVVLTDDATSHPGGATYVAAIVWRGVVYGLTDGLLLSSFPILAVFTAFRGRRAMRSRRGKAAVMALALSASLAFTAVYHAGYRDFRSDKLRKPVAGDVLWSVPTLATLNPLGAPIAHAGMHIAAVVHSYDGDTFLPPHR